MFQLENDELEEAAEMAQWVKRPQQGTEFGFLEHMEMARSGSRHL